jgi:Zn-dependent protease with chaperone function
MIGVFEIAGAIYGVLSSLCMLLSDAIAAHARHIALGILSALALLAATSIAIAFLRVFSTSRLTSNLQRSSSLRLSSRLEGIARRLEIADRVDVVDSSDVFAFAYGLRSPRVMVTQGLVDALADDELEAVLLHERAHVRRSDPLRILAVRSLSAALAFLPTSRGVAESFVCDRELRADKAVVDVMGDVYPLASALQRMLRTPAILDTAGLAVGALSATDVRIDRLLGEETSPWRLAPSPSKLHIVALSAFMALGLCALLATIHAVSGVKPCVPC